MSAEAAPLTTARKKRGRWAVIAIGALVVIIAIVTFVTLSRPHKSATSGLATAKATNRTINVMVSGSGSSMGADSVEVNPQINGTVKTLAVSLGDTVTAGDTLYTISSDSAKNSYLQAKAALLSSEQNVSSASGQLESAEGQLYNAKTQKIQAQDKIDQLKSAPATTTAAENNLKIAKRELHSASESIDNAEIGVDTAELGLASARANLKTSQNSYNTAKSNLDETVVTAPSGGVITALPISVGSAVSAGTSSSSSSGSGSSGSSSAGASGASSTGSGSSSSSSGGSGSSITITDMSSMQVQMTVSEVDVPKVAVGQKATITFDAISGKTFPGSVKSILPNATTSSGVVNYIVYIKLDDLDPSLRTGMTATVDIQTQTVADALSVPSSAVKTDNGAKYVLVVDGAGNTRRKTVKIGVSDDTYTQITEGITGGTIVVTSSETTATTGASRGGGPFGGGPGGGGPGGGQGGN
jgi:macrolide-specific efflux system membrane fusion protein